MNVGPRSSTAHVNEDFLVENFSFQNLIFLEEKLIYCHVAINQSINFTVRGS